MFTTSISLLDQLRDPTMNQAWRRFVKLYAPLFRRWASRLPNMQLADLGDLVQDVFVILLAKLPSFQYKPNLTFRGWLRTIFLNRWRDHWKDRCSAERPLLSGRQGDLISPDHAEVIAEADYRQFLVGRALQLMRHDFEPATWRACWECVAMDRAAAEVAEELGLTRAAVYLAKARILRRLRQELEGLLD